MIQGLFSAEFISILLRFAICLIVNWIIVNFLYFKKSKRRDFYFTFMIISVAIFFLVYLMMSMDRGKATMGVGLGLFGIFSIMRYRTDTMPVREMTYLFVVVCLSVIHAMSEDIGGETKAGTIVGPSIAELLTIDIIIIAVIIMFERILKMESTKLIQYDRIELVKPEKRAELKADLEQRLGIKILAIQVGAIDFLRDMAVLKITYIGDGKGVSDVDNMMKIKRSQLADV
ncbi:MAG: DUF4956 domain-containing protein [Bacteroidaceae bacterium]|nr:DUF4956 domain-containing protein [Bacteroidaceae bacterium]